MASGQQGGVRGSAREREMRRLMAEGERDGLTVRATAERAGIPSGTLAWWRCEIRRRDALRRRTEAGPVFLEVVTPSHAAEPAAEEAGTPCTSAGSPGAASAAEPFEVELRGGRVLRVAAGYGLARLVREIEEC